VIAIDAVEAVKRRASKACSHASAWHIMVCRLSKSGRSLEQTTGTVEGRHDLCGVTGPPPDERDLEVDAEDPFTVSITSSTEKPRP
jgi:hypothetical protein